MLDTTKLKKYLGDARFWRDIARLALPIALQNLLSSSFSLVDTLMVGQLGDTPLAAVGMAGQFGWFLSMILFGMTSALTMFVSQYWGAHDIKSIHKVYGIALAIALGVAGVFTIAGAAFPRGVVWIFNREADVLDVGAQYLSIAAFSYPAIALNYVFMGVLRSTERVKLPLYATLVTTLLNAGLDYAFIFGFGFIPAMGARGAAIATVISAWLSPLITFAVSLIEKNMLIAPIREIFGFDGDFVRVFLRRALPVVANETLWGAGTLVFNIIFANLGSGNYAAVTIMRTFESIAFVFFVGLGSASSVIVGKSVGAGDITAAVRDSRRFAVLVPSFSLLLGAVIIIFRRPIVGVFDLGGHHNRRNAQYGSMDTFDICCRDGDTEYPLHNDMRHFPSGRRNKDGYEVRPSVFVVRFAARNAYRGVCSQAAVSGGVCDNVYSRGLAQGGILRALLPHREVAEACYGGGRRGT